MFFFTIKGLLLLCACFSMRKLDVKMLVEMSIQLVSPVGMIGPRQRMLIGCDKEAALRDSEDLAGKKYLLRL